LLVEEGERAALIFNAKTLKLYSKIKFATQAQQTGAVSIRCRIFSVMVAVGSDSEVSAL